LSSSVITATLSETVDPTSVTAATVALRDASSAVVTATATRRVVVAPAAALAPLASYTATIVGGAGGIRAADTGTLDADVSWTFRTAAAGPLVAALPFTETTGLIAADATGNANVGALQPGVTWVSDGRFGGAAHFAGSTGTSSIDIAASDTLALSDAFTVMA
jgi:hypothetical protein